MNVDNSLGGIDNRSCARRGIALSARPVGDVLQGAAADCNSAHKIITFPKIFNAVSRICLADKTTGQTENASGTLTTGWWLIPSAILGAALWSCIIMAVL